MEMATDLIEELENKFDHVDTGIFVSGFEGYWSNLSIEENKMLIDGLKDNTARQALLKYQPWLENVIYSPKRQAGLELLELKGNEICIDYGCMWGAITIPLAKRTKLVLGIDQTRDSLLFLQARAKEENLDNIILLCADIKRMPDFDNKADVAVVNGVLEWIPEEGAIELTSYYGKYGKKNYSVSPLIQQKRFLEKVYGNLREGGKLYLAIENRYDFKMFFGVKDPHAYIRLTSLLPRKLANLISSLRLGRPYVNWLYSFHSIARLLNDSGFGMVDVYMCFPDYRFPERIIPYGQSLRGFKPTISTRDSQGRIRFQRLIANNIERFVFRVLRARFFAPSIIAVGHK